MKISEIVSQPSLTVKAPQACGDAEITAFCRLVATAGEVQVAGLASRVRQAKLLAFLTVNGQIVGVTAIKRPNPDYRAAVFDKAGAAHPERFPFELGWLVVSREARGQGFSEHLIRAALDRVPGGVFATSAADNAATRRINLKVGLIPAGEAYLGISGRKLVLYTRS